MQRHFTPNWYPGKKIQIAGIFKTTNSCRVSPTGIHLFILKNAIPATIR